MRPMLAGKSKNVSSASRSLSKQSTAFWYLGAYFSAKVAIALRRRRFGTAKFRASRRAVGCTDFGSL